MRVVFLFIEVSGTGCSASVCCPEIYRYQICEVDRNFLLSKFGVLEVMLFYYSKSNVRSI